MLKAVDFVFPEASTRNGEPDPGVWASSGDLMPELSVRGLRIADPDNDSSRLYFHPAAEIGDPRTRTTFRVTYTWDSAGDVSAAWSNDSVGVQIFLDDAQKRVALGFGRDPVTMDRQIVVLGAPGVAPIGFVWDNQFPNIFEIARLPNGDVSLSIFNGDPRAVEPPVVRAISAAQLPPTAGRAMVGFGFGTAGGGLAFWNQAHARIERGILPFSSLSAGAQIGLSPDLAGDRLSLGAQFQLGEGNDGIDPSMEDMARRRHGQLVHPRWLFQPRGAGRIQVPGHDRRRASRRDNSSSARQRLFLRRGSRQRRARRRDQSRADYPRHRRRWRHDAADCLAPPLTACPNGLGI